MKQFILFPSAIQKFRQQKEIVDKKKELQIKKVFRATFTFIEIKLNTY